MNEMNSLIEEGRFLYASHKYKKAEEVFKKVVSTTDKGFADIHNILGLIAHREGRFNDAIKSFKSALKSNPRYTEALLNLSILYNDIGQHENAKKLVERSRKEARSKKKAMDPFIRSKLANKHAEVGDWYHGVGEFGEAIKEYRKALELESGYADIRTKMAVCLRERGSKIEAVEELKKAIKSSAKFVDAHIQLGVTLCAQDKKTEGRRVWREASKKFPSNKTLKMYLKFTQAS